MIRLPTCRNCGRQWKPADDVNAAQSYCSLCSKERRAFASRAVGREMPDPRTVGSYVYNLPRRGKT